jgi:hypothetical protein
MGEMFERAFTEQRLLDAWDDVRTAALADGDGGPEAERFEAAAAQLVSEMAQALADGTFEPQPVVRVEIAKPGGGVRRLAVPSLRDRVVERALSRSPRTPGPDPTSPMGSGSCAPNPPGSRRRSRRPCHERAEVGHADAREVRT